MAALYAHDKRHVDDLTQEFLAESAEGLDHMESCLTDLETRPGDTELLADIFRCVHTIKGTTGFLGFSRLEKLAHAGEHLLAELRDGRLAVNSAIISCLLQLSDGLRGILKLIQETGAEGARTTDEDGEILHLLANLHPAAPSTQQPQPDTSGSVTPVMTPAPAESAAVSPAPHSPSPDRTLRIDVDILNRMMNLVGELVLTRNQLLQSHVDAENFPQLARRLDSVTADLRETVMQARMQPVSTLFGKFPRMVRDIARTCGKSVRVEFSGQDTGLDKSLLEAVKDPITHAVRNCVDHGLEAPGTRLLAGKPAEGVLTLRARHQSGSVIIEIEDDGAGIPTDRVLKKAVERGFITDEQALAMSEREALQLIFLPGFSTATAVTTVSGRGVGMDVVKSNVEKVGGTVEIESTPGVGTCLRLKVPLTLAIVPALVVQSGNQSFCLPQSSLAELVYVPRREAEQSVEHIGDAKLYRLRDTLLPMIWLDELLGIDEADRRHQDHGFYLAVLDADGCRYGLVVDDLMAPEEIVVKPLSSVLRDIGLFSGATVLGNGTLALILDVAATAARAGVRPIMEEAANHNKTVSKSDGTGALFLVFQDRGQEGDTQRTALPLASVERIETVPLDRIEFAGDRALLQYRGELLPLQDAGGLLAELRQLGRPTATILVCSRPPSLHLRGSLAGPQRIGMVVRRVLDVTDGQMLADDTSLFQGSLALVKNRLTVVHTAFAESGLLREVA